MKEDKECTPGNLKEEDGKVYICNKNGRWETYKKKKTIEGGVDRLYGLSSEERKTFLSRS